ncbi:hypothetical protein PUN28_010834 [Cardiocondyla obscurior]|uniref:N-acyl-aliphatic-L-amino acid amidohydrolase n=1 Tax=Cardiocondyla obscurior TaxID=286306 RepID=A0AAW2FIC7_9HYME
MPKTCETLDELAVENFREYLRIPTVQPDVNYDKCVAFLNRQAQSLNLEINTYNIHPQKPIVIMTWKGTQPSKPSILLNSHMDVVPVFEDKWIYPPFSAHMDEKGDIYARGAQDMKSVGIQYLEAIRRLKLKEQRFQRTIHISFVPDEEIGSSYGMRDFVHTAEFKALNIGFELDEGMATPDESIYMSYGEKTTWHLEIKCAGNTGHGSIMLDNTAGEKLRVILDRFTDFRASEKAKIKDCEPIAKALGKVTAVNLTKIWGGIQANVIPNELNALFDIRVTPFADHDEFEAAIKHWCKEAGPNVTYSFVRKEPKVENTNLDDSNPFWIAFKNICDEINVNLEIGIALGGSDSRFVRQMGIPAFGFSPMNRTTIRLHDHNEYLNKDVFLKGIEIYTHIIPAIANV